MKIHILFPFKEGPTGGGNQFLKAIREKWRNLGLYEESLEKADVVLFNNHHWLKEAFWAKKKFPQKVFIHRMDGPMEKCRPAEAFLDKLIFKSNRFAADGTVWQSKWSQAENKKIFPYERPYEVVVHNASNEKIFNKIGKTSFNPQNKVKLVAVSWSQNVLKGFDFYQFLDANLDFRKYKMTFVGRSPVSFQNIKMIEPQVSEKIAEILKQNDIFITGSKIESCSNALIEAISSGLPCLAFNSSSNPEIIGKGGELFESPEGLLGAIEKVAKNYNFYQRNLPVFSLEKIAKQYFDFAKRIFDDSQGGYYFPRQVGLAASLSFVKTRFFVNVQKVLNKL